MDRRSFLKVAATAAAGVAVGSERARAAGLSPLTPDDFRYLGLFKLPEDDPTGAGTRFGYSTGTLATRRVNGELRVFITGANSTAGGGDYRRLSDAPYEVVYPGVGGINDAPRATLIRNWGDIYAGRRLLRDTNQAPMTRGLLYDNGTLWWSYGSQYFTGFDPDPSLGATLLNDSTGAINPFGPWRTQEHSQRTRGYWAMLPSDFATAYTGGRRLAVGAPVTSGSAQGPRGSVLYALDKFDPTKLTADSAGSTNGTIPYSVGCQRLVHHDSATPQARNSNYKVCGWNVLYDASQGSWIKPGDASFDNNTIAVDHFSAATWVQTSTRAGLVFIGSIVDVIAGADYAGDTVPHLWYGPAGVKCCHGQTGLWDGTGPHTATQVPMICIYNPSDVAQAASGIVPPWGFQPTSFVRLNTLAPGGINAQSTQLYQFGGAAFDPVENLLLVSEVNREVVGEPRPVVHVFQIGASGTPPPPTNVRVVTSA